MPKGIPKLGKIKGISKLPKISALKPIKAISPPKSLIKSTTMLKLKHGNTRAPAPAGKSSNVAAFNHDPQTNTLNVQFRSGKTYSYSGVPADLFKKMSDAPSKGQFLHQNVIGIFPTKS